MGMTKRGMDSGAAHPHGTTDATWGGGFSNTTTEVQTMDSRLLMTFRDCQATYPTYSPLLGKKTDEMSSLFKALDGDKDLNSSKEL